MISPVPATDIPALRARALGIPARTAAGVHCVDLRPGHSHWEMNVPAWLAADDGTAPPGALGILVDGTLGTAAMSVAPGHLSMVTSHLQLEVLAPLRADRGPVTCIGMPTALEERFALTAAEVTDGDGTVVARASMGSVMFANGRQVQDHDEAPEVTEPDRLGLVVVSADDGTVTTRTPAHAWLANSFGGLHGGAGFLIGERTLQLAVDAGDVHGIPMRAVEVRAAFLRPIPADGRPIDASATIVHRGRRLGAVRGEVRGPDGRPALLVDATYVPSQ